MKTRKKIIATLAMLIIILFLYEVITHYQSLVGLQRQLPSLSMLPWGNIVPYFYFYGGIILLLSCIFYIFFMWIYLDRYDLLTLSEDKKGKLQLKSSAIESYVRLIIEEHRWIDEPKVTVHTKKDKIIIDIEGDLRRTSGIVGKSELLIAQIQSDLKNLLGISKEISTEITFKDTANQKSIATPSKRVE